MNKLFKHAIGTLLLVTLCAPALAGTMPTVRLTTSAGVIDIELDAERAPKTVENFLTYVEDGHFDGLIFHRVIPGFMIQGGGFTPSMEQRETRDPVINEADNGLTNRRGTLAMARTQVVNSASAQFFINLVDNDFLNHSGKTVRGWGYAVFGQVTAGMEVVDAIAKVRTGTKGPFQNMPNEPVLILSAKRLDTEAGAAQ